MKLEIGNFHVKEIRFGERTYFENGCLTVCREEALAFIKKDPHITEAELEIVNPGE